MSWPQSRLRPTLLSILFGWPALAAVAACGTDRATLGLWAPCETSDECESGVCEWIFSETDMSTCPPGTPTLGGCSGLRCTEDCSRTDCPAESVCGTNASGRQVCMGICPEGDGYEGVGACAAGSFHPCAELGGDERFCYYCGCAVPGDVCLLVPDHRCDPPLAPGSLCISDEDCASGICTFCPSSAAATCPEEVCSVPFGAPCTTETCGLCVGTEPATFCTEYCYTDRGCPDGYMCAQRLYHDSYYACWKRCSTGDACPIDLTCQAVANEWGSIVGHACL